MSADTATNSLAVLLSLIAKLSYNPLQSTLVNYYPAKNTKLESITISVRYKKQNNDHKLQMPQQHMTSQLQKLLTINLTP